jgi:hypothetical protein
MAPCTLVPSTTFVNGQMILLNQNGDVAGTKHNPGRNSEVPAPRRCRSRIRHSPARRMHGARRAAFVRRVNKPDSACIRENRSDAVGRQQRRGRGRGTLYEYTSLPLCFVTSARPGAQWLPARGFGRIIPSGGGGERGLRRSAQFVRAPAAAVCQVCAFYQVKEVEEGVEQRC